MARTSKSQEKKVEIFADFVDGLKPNDLYQKYLDVPDSTIRSWYKIYLDKTDPESAEKQQNSKTHSLTVLDGAKTEDTDFRIARRTLRRIAQDQTAPYMAQISAAKGLLDIPKLRRDIPQHILDELEQITRQTSQRKLEDLSVDELDRRYKDLLRLS